MSDIKSLNTGQQAAFGLNVTQQLANGAETLAEGVQGIQAVGRTPAGGSAKPSEESPSESSDPNIAGKKASQWLSALAFTGTDVKKG